MGALAYTGPSDSLMKIANAVAYGGSILPSSPPAPNSSYQQDFSGPAFVCSNASSADYAGFETALKSATSVGALLEENPTYLAWAPVGADDDDLYNLHSSPSDPLFDATMNSTSIGMYDLPTF